MNTKYCVEFSHGRAGEQKFFTGLTRGELVNVILRRGAHRMMSIRHDDAEPKNTHQLNVKEVISIWKEVSRISDVKAGPFKEAT